MAKVLVTGGAGFVGRHLVRRLLERGDEVHCVDPVVPLTGGLPPERWPLFRPLDYAGFRHHGEDCRAYFRRAEARDFDLAFHLAAMVGGRLMIENHPLAVADDLAIDAEFWQWAERTRPGRIACFSSSAAYPVRLQRRDGYVLLEEDMIRFDGDIGMPDMSYGWAKLTCEYLARLAYQRHGLKSVVYRPFSGYGEDQDDTYPFPGICKRALAGRGSEVLTVWGSGEQMRDFIHIEDCITGILATLHGADDATPINLSTGRYTSFIEFGRLAAELCGYRPRVLGTSDKPEGVFARAGDTARQRRFGFEARIAFRDGVQRALAYYEARR